MYELKSRYEITLAQKQAVDQVSQRFQERKKRQVLLGVTGSGKTFAMAHIIRELDRPALILSPNKTLAAQLYQEFRGFFPGNRVGYFVSYYDYYLPEAYVPQKNLYIAKEVSINPELERLRIDAARNILESKNTVIIASVSAIYSIGSPDDFFSQKITFSLDAKLNRDQLMRQFISLGYNRTEDFIESGQFRVRGDLIEIFPTSEENPVRFVIEDAILRNIEIFDAVTASTLEIPGTTTIFPVSYFHYKKKRVDEALDNIKRDLKEQICFFKSRGKHEFAERLNERTLCDIELLEQYGHCPGIENYSLYLTGRKTGDPPYTLLDFFGDDYLLIIDESHIAVPQLRGMYEGDQSRKKKLVGYGFRLPSALDNRPLNFHEINSKLRKVLYVSATPSFYEIKDSNNQVNELLVRPTGLLDPEITIKKSDSPVDDMINELQKEMDKKGRVLITTLTKKMSEKLTDYLAVKGFKCTYLHSEIKLLDRIKVIKKLRIGDVDILVGINLLREGLDLPEVSLVVLLDADREGYLRSETSLIQTFGRAARNVNGRVILYIKKMTGSLKKAIDESKRRRQYQINYNQKHQITPRSITKKIKDFYDDDYWIQKSQEDIDVDFKSKENLIKEIEELTKAMKKKAENLDFKTATKLRDRIKYLKNIMLELY
ncbi:MAG: excinuclease ABC subunit UvrB [Candidatus Aminicenantes bacterium]|nr:excinuclease ABC subunit UvrB [Candidatus Aminicenantes bacterium]